MTNEDIILKYPDIKPKKKIFAKIYLSILLFVLGRGFQAASKSVKEIKKESAELPDGFSFSLNIDPIKLNVSLKKDNRNYFKCLGINYKPYKIGTDQPDNIINFRNISSAMKVFTFSISSAISYAQNGISVKGGLPETLAVLRILNLVEYYLLPGFIVKGILKRYPSQNWFVKIFLRIAIYVRLIIGV